jgi:hypothetical protein
MKPQFGAPRPLDQTAAKRKETQMNKRLLARALLAGLSTETFAGHAGTDQDEKACIRDVERLCRQWMDQAVLPFWPA